MSEAGYAGIAEALEEAVPVDGSTLSATMATIVMRFRCYLVDGG